MSDLPAFSQIMRAIGEAVAYPDLVLLRRKCESVYRAANGEVSLSALALVVLAAVLVNVPKDVILNRSNSVFIKMAKEYYGDNA